MAVWTEAEHADGPLRRVGGSERAIESGTMVLKDQTGPGPDTQRGVDAQSDRLAVGLLTVDEVTHLCISVGTSEVTELCRGAQVSYGLTSCFRLWRLVGRNAMLRFPPEC